MKRSAFMVNHLGLRVYGPRLRIRSQGSVSVGKWCYFKIWLAANTT